MLNTIFTEVLPKNTWLRVMDYMITHPESPDYIIYIAVAGVLSKRTTILQCKDKNMLTLCLQKQIGINPKHLIKLIKKVYNKSNSYQLIKVPYNNDTIPLQQGEF